MQYQYVGLILGPQKQTVSTLRIKRTCQTPQSHLAIRKSSSINHALNKRLLTNQIPVPGCLFANVELWFTVASGALSQSRIFADI